MNHFYFQFNFSLRYLGLLPINLPVKPNIYFVIIKILLLVNRNLSSISIICLYVTGYARVTYARQRERP